MIPIPAIDLKNKKVVRLLQGNFKEEKVYSEFPEKVAKRFEADGAQRLHIVDLDGALSGFPKNISSVEAILKSVRTPLEVGGGIRSLKVIEDYLAIGVSWIILGTRACLDKGFMQEAIREFGKKVIVGVDARDGWVATDGWTVVTKVKAFDLAKEAEALGAKTVIYTDISKDGVLKGPNMEGITHLSHGLSIDVIASGGISSLADLKLIASLNQKNILGVIIGKALYENKFSFKDAVKTCVSHGGGG